jgi:beta-lactamase superfamily II metal-dependent hydrolase
VTRFISTHPDDDHIKGLARLDDALAIRNFHRVENRATKPEATVDFDRYCELRDDPERAYPLYRGISRCWLNKEDATRGSSGISVLWPDVNDPDFKNVLNSAAEGGSPNNLSTILKYGKAGGVTMIWFGDLETDFMETVEDRIEFPEVDVVFAAHHGRARLPAGWIGQMNPKIIVIGEAPKEHLEYYDGRDHIRQNTALDITFENETGRTDVYVGNPEYEAAYLDDHGLPDTEHGHYLGSFETGGD